jgi:hypothetical protein
MRPPSRSSNVVDHLQPADLGLLAAAAPELAGCIAALRSLGDLTFPLRTRGELCAALFRDAHGDDAIFAGHGLRFTRAELEAVLPDELFPMETLHDLALRAFTGVAAAHARHRAERWAALAVPTEGPTVGVAPPPAVPLPANAAIGGAYCPAHTWTKVLYASALLGTYVAWFSFPGVSVRWRRYSVFPPWYTEGTYTTGDPFQFEAQLVCDPYVDFWFNPDRNVGVSWVPDGEIKTCVPKQRL